MGSYSLLMWKTKKNVLADSFLPGTTWQLFFGTGGTCLHILYNMAPEIKWFLGQMDPDVNV